MDRQELLLNSYMLRLETGGLFREYGLEFCWIREIVKPEGYRLAFAYMKRQPNGGISVRYIDIPVSDDEFRFLKPHHRENIMNKLRDQIKSISPTPTSTAPNLAPISSRE